MAKTKGHILGTYRLIQVKSTHNRCQPFVGQTCQLEVGEIACLVFSKALVQISRVKRIVEGEEELQVYTYHGCYYFRKIT